jgi:hypothetical protein
VLTDTIEEGVRVNETDNAPVWKTLESGTDLAILGSDIGFHV